MFVSKLYSLNVVDPHLHWGTSILRLNMVPRNTVCDNITLSFRFGFVYTERSNRLNGRSVSSVCLTAFWQNGGKTIE